MTTPLLELQSVVKEYDAFRAVDDVSFSVSAGGLVSLLGPSGSGKTTILRLVAGFDSPTSGIISLNGETINRMPAHKRPVTTVFQQYSLFPHMNVYENLAFGLRARIRLPESTIREKVGQSLELVKMSGKERRSIRNLSGGEQQRIALARSLITEPDVLLLDEPLGALDLKLRREMSVELRKLHKRIGMTFLYVTHDQEEALSMSDEVVVIHNGRIRQAGSPRSLYSRPAEAFVADFIGGANILTGRVLEVTGNNVRFELENGNIEIACWLPNSVEHTSASRVAIRPETIAIDGLSDDRECCVPATITDMRFYGAVTEIEADLSGQTIRVRAPGALDAATFSVGQEITLGWNVDDATVVAGEQ